MNNAHTFHIPVMGIGYTIDTPIKVAPLGISSVISLLDDHLIERFRALHCEQNQLEYIPISKNEHDFRAKRITQYLNLIKKLVDDKLNNWINNPYNQLENLKKYFDLLPDASGLKHQFENKIAQTVNENELSNWLKQYVTAGSIDVNIMTKVDKEHYKGDEKLPAEFNDAHVALRGFAQSDLNASVILSAGMNPRLYGYLENFEDFYPTSNGEIKKKIVLKVSDFRSALIQGKFLAKKGIWVSEYRIESGLNCGGHAFATDGFLMGPILEEFRAKRKELTESVYELLVQSLAENNKVIPQNPLTIKITAQGGVGTAEEHLFLMDHYQVDSIGWGSPFLLVPEVVAIDNETVDKLAAAKEEDIYLSEISPLGVRFNNLKNNTKDQEKQLWIDAKTPGSPCPKKYVALNGEFTEKPICSASRQYQKLKIEQLRNAGLSDKEFEKQYKQTTDKACICVGLGTSALLANNLDTRIEGSGVSVCPGPNLAYYSQKMSLNEMVAHIYGRQNVIQRTDRPHVFVKELTIYMDYLKNEMANSEYPHSTKDTRHFLTFSQNLMSGIYYYEQLFENLNGFFESEKVVLLKQLLVQKDKLQSIISKLEITPKTTAQKVLS